MKIVMTGGGSGGHITPILAVANELSKLESAPEIIYIGQRGDKVAALVTEDTAITTSYYISAGKLRRYHGDGVRQLLDMRTMALNIRDSFRTLMGLWQAWRLLGKIKPDALFIKGGFVGVPVGLAAAARRIPFITHDSDSIPGLANRIIARWASLHAVALPKEIYTYDPATTIMVGVPISDKYKPVNKAAMAAARQKIGIPAEARVILLTGGGLGAQTLNEAVVASAPILLARYPELYIIMLVGHKHTVAMERALQGLPTNQKSRIIVKDFVSDLYTYSAAADVVVTRAGATSIAEFAAQAKACIIVPHPGLTGGHQLKNADVLQKSGAAVIVHNDTLLYQPESLAVTLVRLLDAPVELGAISQKLATFARLDSAEQLAVLLMKVARG